MFLGFSDDIDFISIDRKAVEEAFVYLKRMWTINSTKANYVVVGRDSDRPCQSSGCS